MWTVENRGSYDRGGLRYPSDVTDDEWAHIAPLIPPAKRGGRKRNVDVRDVVNGLMYILSTGCQWRAMSYVRKLVTELSGGVFGYLDSVLERHSFDEFGELI